MSFEASLIIGIFIVVTSLVALTAMVARRSMKAKEEEMRQAASSRGWTFAVANERGYRIQRWKGTTDGVQWVAEYLHRGGNKSHQRRDIARWHGTFSPGINGAIVVMGVPKGKEQLGTTIAEGDGFIAKMAQKAAGFAFDKAIDVYFGEDAGKEVDAGAMHRADTEKLPGFIVMAANKDEGVRVLSDGLEKALIDASNDPATLFADKDYPWVLLRPSTISLARMNRYRDIADLERFVRTGVALTRSFRFGRPIS